jgi:hypothetical protein
VVAIVRQDLKVSSMNDLKDGLFGVSSDSVEFVEQAAKLLEISTAGVDRLVASKKLRLGTNGLVDEVSAISYLSEREPRLDRVAAIAEADAKLGIEYR